MKYKREMISRLYFPCLTIVPSKHPKVLSISYYIVVQLVLIADTI